MAALAHRKAGGVAGSCDNSECLTRRAAEGAGARFLFYVEAGGGELRIEAGCPATVTIVDGVLTLSALCPVCRTWHTHTPALGGAFTGELRPVSTLPGRPSMPAVDPHAARA